MVVVGYVADAVGTARRSWRSGASRSPSSTTTRPRSGTTPTRSGWRASTSPGVLLVNGDTVHPVSVEKTLLAERGPGHPARRGHAQAAGRGGDEDHLRRRRPPHPDHQADGPGRGVRRVHRRDAHRAAGGRRRSPTPWRRPGGATRTSTTRTATRSSPSAAARCGPRPIGDVSWVEVDNHDDLARAREIACRY